jgi:protein-tyrosine phosphatase
MSQPDVFVLFVCMGNICRSPTAHGVFQSRVLDLGWGDRVVVDSAGTHNYHPDAPPDARSQAHAKRRGYDLSALRARQVTEHDFVQADLIVAMDAANIQNLEQRCPPEHRQKLRLLTEFCQKYDAEEVPDPYYGGAQGFERVLDLIEDACEGLVQHLESISKGGKTPARG